MYSENSLVESDFVDFHIRIESSEGIRRFVRKQANFSFDGVTPFLPLPIEQAYPLFEWGYNWVISGNYHSCLMFHAAVLEKDGKAVIMPGTPGSGKSTLTAALSHNGWRLLSDELTIFDYKNNQILPLSRPVSLKNESINVIKAFAPDSVFGNISHDTHKGSVAHMKPPQDTLSRSSEPAVAKWIVFPKYVANSETILQEKSRGVTLINLAQNAFNYSILGATAFDFLARALDDCDCYDFRYSQLSEAIDAFNSL